jgi:hypothetical protein
MDIHDEDSQNSLCSSVKVKDTTKFTFLFSTGVHALLLSYRHSFFLNTNFVIIQLYVEFIVESCIMDISRWLFSFIVWHLNNFFCQNLLTLTEWLIFLLYLNLFLHASFVVCMSSSFFVLINDNLMSPRRRLQRNPLLMFVLALYRYVLCSFLLFFMQIYFFLF